MCSATYASGTSLLCTACALTASHAPMATDNINMLCMMQVHMATRSDRAQRNLNVRRLVCCAS